MSLVVAVTNKPKVCRTYRIGGKLGPYFEIVGDVAKVIKAPDSRRYTIEHNGASIADILCTAFDTMSEKDRVELTKSADRIGRHCPGLS